MFLYISVIVLFFSSFSSPCLDAVTMEIIVYLSEASLGRGQLLLGRKAVVLQSHIKKTHRHTKLFSSHHNIPTQLNALNYIPRKVQCSPISGHCQSGG